MARRPSKTIRARAQEVLSKVVHVSGEYSGVVYYIGAPKSGLVKIGFTTNLPARFERLQANSPIILVVLAAHTGDPEDELTCHRMFADERRHAEWFERSDGVMSHVRFWSARLAKRRADPKLDALVRSQSHRRTPEILAEIDRLSPSPLSRIENGL